MYLRYTKLADTRLGRQRLDHTSLQQVHGYDALDQKVQTLMTSLSEGLKGFEELRFLMRSENEQTRSHVTNVVQQSEEVQKKMQNQKRLLDSLWFEEIYCREERIVDAHKGTLEWIFDESNQAVGPWDNLAQWLKCGKGTYWISGKAGAGKSTLMSFLTQDERTMRLLKIWGGDSDVLVPKFFFWNAGTTMEKSIEGLLRSLLWQILHMPGILDAGILPMGDPPAAWTERRLQTAIQKSVGQVGKSHRLCFFIDGLDEFDGDHDKLIKFVQDMVQNANIKICLSSRPYQTFEIAFGPFAKLRLQDLTYQDICTFVVDAFEDITQVKSIISEDPHWIEEVMTEIVTRAEGVFLWVSLAVKDQIHGIKMEDNLQQLKERLDSLPSEVEGIYASMLSRIEKPHRKEASQLLQLALHGKIHSLLDFSVASYARLDEMLESTGEMSESDLILMLTRTRKRILATCAGLLEIHDKGVRENVESWSIYDSDSSSDLSADEFQFKTYVIPDSTASVQLIHRTALDFVRSSEVGQTFLQVNATPGFNARVSYVKVLIAQTKLSGRFTKVDAIMDGILSLECSIGVAQTALCELFYATMCMMNLRTGDERVEVHWTDDWKILARWSDEGNKLIFEPHRKFRKSQLGHTESLSSTDSLRDTPDGSIMKSSAELGFLPFAAAHGLCRYVQHVLRSRKVSLRKDLANLFLWCTVNSVRKKAYFYDRMTADLRLMEEFLSQGGDPNSRAGELTIWSQYLRHMHWTLSYNHLQLVHHQAKLAEIRDSFMQTTIAFIEQGADLHLTYSFSITSGGWLPVPGYLFTIRLSASAIIEMDLHDQAQFFLIKEKFVHEGARNESACLKMGVLFNRSDSGRRGAFVSDFAYTETDPSRLDCIEPYREFDLSEQESNEFLEFYKRDWTDADANDRFRHQMQSFGDRIYVDRLGQSKLEDLDPPSNDFFR